VCRLCVARSPQHVRQSRQSCTRPQSSHGLPRLRGRTPHAGNSGVSCAPQQATGRRRARRRRACRSGSRSANRYHSSHSIWCYGIGAIRCEECAARLTQPVCIEEPSGVTVVVGLPPACALAQFGAFGARRVALLVRLTRLDATAARRSPNPRRKARVVRLPLARLWHKSGAYMYWYCTLHCLNGPRTHDDVDRSWFPCPAHIQYLVMYLETSSGSRHMQQSTEKLHDCL